MPMRKVVKIERVKVNSAKSTLSSEEDDKVEDDDDDFSFEKVHTTNFDLPLKPVITLNDPDVERDEEERKEEAKEAEAVASWFDHLTSFGLFDKKEEAESDQQDEQEANGLFGWLTGSNNKAADTDENDKDGEGKKWFSYLKSIIVSSESLVSDDDSTTKKETRRRGKSDDLIIEKREPLTAQSFEKLLLSIPSFVPNYTKIYDVDCRRMGQIFQRQVRGQKLWALQMMDASAKLPSGLLRGNANQLGDFDLCTGIRTKVKIKDDKTVKIKGKYCLANIDIVAGDEQLKMSIHLVQGRNFLRSRLEDPSHFLPRYSTLKWALCIPNGCSNENALQILNDFIRPFNSTGVKIFAEIDENSCYVRSNKSWLHILSENWQIAATVGYFVLFISLAIGASLNDYWSTLKLDILFAPDKKKDIANDDTDVLSEHTSADEKEENIESCAKGITRFLMEFSIKRTSKTLFSFDEEKSDNTFSCIDGLKGLATIPLFLSLKLLTFGHLPFTNKAQLTKILNSPLSVFLRAAFLFMDVFLLVSGFYAGYKFSKELNDYKSIAWFRRAVARFIRLFPSLVAAISFSAWILPYIGSGPQWGPLIEQNSELCQQNLWKNIFFLQNFFPAHEQCSPHLQQICIEFQLFLLAPLLVYLMEKNSIVGVGLFAALSAFSVGMRYSSALSERLSFVVFQGMKLSQFYRTLDISFNSTLQRSTSYLIGLVLGVLIFGLNDVRLEVKVPRGIIVMGWLTCAWGLIWCFWTPSILSSKDYVYEPQDAAVYAAWAPLVWSLALSWIIFVIFIENGKLLSRILNARPLVLLSRISYQIFFVQFLVLFYFTASVKNVDTFTLASFINYWEIFTILGISTVATILFDLPLREISKVITTRTASEEETKSGAEELTKDEGEDVDGNEKSVDNEIDEIWNNENQPKVSFVDSDAVADETYSKRTFTPVWKRSDDEKPVWGDEDDDEA
ncbi:Nose resistant to fluoxetine protein 6, partial [Pseudolycoriella hygida]